MLQHSQSPWAKFPFACALTALVVAGSAPPGNAATPAERWNALSQREKTFLQFVYAGDEAKAVEYAQVAGINANSISGEPLSVWFYRNAFSTNGPTPLRNLNTHRIVFERFHQNPNPQIAGETHLRGLCGYAPYPVDIQMQNFGTPAQKQALQNQQTAARKAHIDNMAAAFDSLQRYGLKDRHLVDELFLGCFFFSGASMADGAINEYLYDTMVSRLVRAGANINMETVGGERPIQFAVRTGYPAIVERLLRDGAKVNFLVRANGFEHPANDGPCAPRLNVSLYSYSHDWVRSRNPQAVIRLVRALASVGVSALTKYGYQANDGSGRCLFKSFYDAVLDTGNIEFAKAVKEAAESASHKGQAAPVAPAAKMETASLAPPNVSMAPPSGSLPRTFGGWRVAASNDGRLAATASAGGDLNAIRIECVAGRLEYVPVSASGQPVQSLWLPGTDDVLNELRLTNGRASGAFAAQLSKEFLAAEARAIKDGGGGDWAMEVAVNDSNRDLAAIKAAGFSKARSYMLQACKH